MRIIAVIAVIDDAGVIERILKHPGVWDTPPKAPSALRY
jgi:hypothetical protein